jgi:hypothetical protein
MTLFNEANIHYWFPNSFHYFSEVAIVALSIDWLTLIFYAYGRCTVGKNYISLLFPWQENKQ